MDQLNIIITAIGVIVLFLGLVSNYFRQKWWISDPLVALLLGILLSPIALGLINPEDWGISQAYLLEQAARFTLAIGLMGIALRLPRGYFTHNWKSLAILLGLVMPMMWIASGLLVYRILNLPFWEAMMIGAAITPTDPIVSTSIVTGVVAEQNLPGRLRHMISAESGANDGLAYPFVLLAILMVGQSAEATSVTTINTLSHWFTHVVLWEVGAAIIFGAAFGYIAGYLLEWAERKKLIEQQSFLGYTIALSLTTLGGAKLIGTDGILSVFIAGLAFDYPVKGQERSEEDNVQEAINRFFTLPIFVLLGLTLPWQQWWTLGWRNLVLVVTVLLLRRIPALLLFYRWIKPTKTLPEAMFVGWFGPIGVAAIYYAGYCLKRTGIKEVWLVCSLIICASIVAHGFSAVPLTKLYSKFSRAEGVQGASGSGGR